MATENQLRGSSQNQPKDDKDSQETTAKENPMIIRCHQERKITCTFSLLSFIWDCFGTIFSPDSSNGFLQNAEVDLLLLNDLHASKLCLATQSHPGGKVSRRHGQPRIFLLPSFAAPTMEASSQNSIAVQSRPPPAPFGQMT